MLRKTKGKLYPKVLDNCRGSRDERFKRIFNDPSFLVSASGFSGIRYFIAHEHPITFVAELLVHFFIVDGVADGVVLLMFFKDFF